MVGPGPGVEYLTWLAEADLPDPETVLADPDNFTLPDRGDRAYAALSSIAAAVAADPSNDRWERGGGHSAAPPIPLRMLPQPLPVRSPAAAQRAPRFRPRSKRSHRCYAMRACLDDDVAVDAAARLGQSRGCRTSRAPYLPARSA